MRLDVVDNDALPGRGGRPARADANADFQSIDRCVIEIRQAWRDTLAETFALAIQQQDAANHLGIELLHAAHNTFEHVLERSASGQQLQRLAAKLFIPSWPVLRSVMSRNVYDDRIRPGFAIRDHRLRVHG